MLKKYLMKRQAPIMLLFLFVLLGHTNPWAHRTKHQMELLYKA